MNQSLENFFNLAYFKMLSHELLVLKTTEKKWVPAWFIHGGHKPLYGA